MNVTAKRKEPEFKPVEVIITLENQEEVEVLEKFTKEISLQKIINLMEYEYNFSVKSAKKVNRLIFLIYQQLNELINK